MDWGFRADADSPTLARGRRLSPRRGLLVWVPPPIPGARLNRRLTAAMSGEDFSSSCLSLSGAVCDD